MKDYRPKPEKGEWTVESVKKYLPLVPVELAQGRIVEREIGGRKHRFAHVSIPTEPGSYERYNWIEVAWETVVNVLNKGTHIRI